MQDVTHQHDGDGNDEFPMTILAIGLSYWIYEGDDLLNDLLFGNGAYPFKVRCYVLENAFDLNGFMTRHGERKLRWRINPEIIDRVRREKLLVEIFSPDV